MIKHLEISIYIYKKVQKICQKIGLKNLSNFFFFKKSVGGYLTLQGTLCARISVKIRKLKVCRKFNPFCICIVVFIEKCRNENTLKQFWKDLGLFYCPFNCYAQGMPRNSIKAQIGRFNWKFFYGKRIVRVKSGAWGRKAWWSYLVISTSKPAS